MAKKIVNRKSKQEVVLKTPEKVLQFECGGAQICNKINK